MFGKLIKNEFKLTGGPIAITFAVYVLLSAVLLGAIRAGVVPVLAMVLLFLISLGQSFVVLGLLVVNYYRSMSGRTAYLTHSVPVPPTHHYFSKMIVSSLYLFLSQCALISVLWLGYRTSLRDDVSADISRLYSSISQSVFESLGMSGIRPFLPILAIILLLLSCVFSCATYFFAVTLGTSRFFRKMGVVGPIIVYFIQSSIMQVLVMAAMFTIPLGMKISVDLMRSGEMVSVEWVNKSYAWWFFEQISSTSSGEVSSSFIGVGAYIVQPVLMAILILWSIRIVKKHSGVR